MSKASTNLNNANITDDYVSPATDVWMTDVDQSQLSSDMTWPIGEFPGWPVLIAENVTTFEDPDLIETGVPIEISFGELKTIFVTLSLPEKTAWSFAYNTFIARIPTYVPVEDRFRPSPRQTFFSPDFFNIKKYLAYIMRRTPVSILELEEASEATRDIPIAIHPEVIWEAEEEAVIDDLETSIKIAQDTYSTLKRIEISIEYDPEILDRKTIRFTLTVSGEPETILQNEALFKHHLRSSIDARARELITVTYGWENN